MIVGTPESYANAPKGSITLSPTGTSDHVGGSHTVTATAFGFGGLITGEVIDFAIVSGPNTGNLGSGPCTTNAAGTCTFTYTSNGVAGMDTITAESSPVFVLSPGTATETWTLTTPVGGTTLPVDMTALFVAGLMTNAFWMVPTLGGIAGAAIALFKVKRKRE